LNVTNNQLKKIINKQFYARLKELKSPSPIQISCPKYSKKKVTSNANENTDINHNSNISTVSQMEEISNLRLLTDSNTNSNISTLEGKFDVLKNIKHNKSNTSSNVKSPDISTGLSYDSVTENNNMIILNKIKNKANNSNQNENCSDDEILVYATPTKTNAKFGKKSPNSAISSKVNLMNLFNQFKQQKK
jgi:hypothetical protein